jgi:hypothetical protein
MTRPAADCVEGLDTLTERARDVGWIHLRMIEEYAAARAHGLIPERRRPADAAGRGALQ